MQAKLPLLIVSLQKFMVSIRFQPRPSLRLRLRPVKEFAYPHRCIALYYITPSAALMTMINYFPDEQCGNQVVALWWIEEEVDVARAILHVIDQTHGFVDLSSKRNLWAFMMRLDEPVGEARVPTSELATKTNAILHFWRKSDPLPSVFTDLDPGPTRAVSTARQRVSGVLRPCLGQTACAPTVRPMRESGRSQPSGLGAAARRPQ